MALKGAEISPDPVKRIAPTHSLVYLVATGELIEIGPAGTKWMSGPEEEMAKFDIQEVALSADAADTYKALSKGGGGDGLALNAAGVKEQMAATMPAPLRLSKAEAAPAEFEALIAAASAEVLASRRVGD